MIEDLINQAENVDCFDKTDISLFKDKTVLLNQALNSIEAIISKDEDYAKRMLYRIQNIIFNYHYDAAYSRTIEYEAAKYVNQLSPKLVELGERVFEGKELVPFLKEKLNYTWDDKERSDLYKRIDELEK